MDIREVPEGEFNRHPWEISRAKMTISIMASCLRDIHKDSQGLNIADIGAGDMYFDKEYLKVFPKDRIWAIDDEYKVFTSEHDHILIAKAISEFSGEKFDVAVMMNLMEYIPDEVRFLEELITHMQPDGILFFILPAYSYLFSQHDVYVKGLRRYNHRSFKKIIENTRGVELKTSFYFYSSLFIIRTFKRVLRIPTDTDQRKVPLWKYSADHFYTRAITAMLNIDFHVWRLLQKTGIKLPGLSLFAVCTISRGDPLNKD